MEELEIWKPVVGYEGLYEVSNIGRVKSLERYVNDRGGFKLLKERILKEVQSRSGHLKVKLSKNSMSKLYFTHRLVAQAFIPNPDNLPVINHKDEDPINNRVENLEWCTVAYNNRYGTVRQRQAEKAHLRKHPTQYKKVYQYTKSGELIKEWESICSIQNDLGYNRGNISACCLRKPHYHTAYGYVWRFAKEGF